MQLVTRQGPKPLKVKVHPGADASIIPLSRYRSLFPHHFHTNGTLRSRSLRKTNATWSAHDGTTHNFLGFFTIDVQHKTKPDVIPISFYVFKDSTRPFTLLSNAASIHLGIIEFKVPNEANSHTIDSIKTKEKKISFSTPLCYSTPTKSTQKKSQKLKPALKQNTTDNITSQDHHRSQVHSLQDHSLSSQDHCAPDYLKNDAFQDHVSSKDHFPIPKHTENHTFQDHCSVKDVQNIISLKKVFPHSFDTTGSRPGVYTIRLDPSVPPVQHTRRKVPIECREAIEKLLQDTVDQAIIAPVTEPMEWVSSLTYPHKADGSLCICLDPPDLNKAIIWEHYKAPTLDEINP